jgi:xanthine/uracil permease
VRLPSWFWISFLFLCSIQWGVGLWVERLTSSSSQALILIGIVSFIIYPIFSIISLIYFKKKQLPKATILVGIILLIVGFLTNPSVFQIIRLNINI